MIIKIGKNKNVKVRNILKKFGLKFLRKKLEFLKKIEKINEQTSKSEFKVPRLRIFSEVKPVNLIKKGFKKIFFKNNRATSKFEDLKKIKLMLI